MQKSDAHPLCDDIIEKTFDWRPPETSKSSLFAKHSVFKSDVELFGPGGLIKPEPVRLGSYGMLSDLACGVRTYPVTEMYIMPAGKCFCKRGDALYCCERSNGRSHH